MRMKLFNIFFAENLSLSYLKLVNVLTSNEESKESKICQERYSQLAKVVEGWQVLSILIKT